MDVTSKQKHSNSKSPSPSPCLLPPASSTPSSIKKTKVTKLPHREKLTPQKILSPQDSPLRLRLKHSNDKSRRTIQSSPIRKTSFPSPSPESPQPIVNGRRVHNSLIKSSPLKVKKVVFSENLVKTQDSSHHDGHLKLKTPVKSILKTNVPTLSPATDNLYFNASSPLHGDTTPSKLEFWSPGNIPRLSSTTSAEDDLSSFKSLLQGGIMVLETTNNSKQFEIYATLFLLFKDLNGQKLSYLLSKIKDLLRIAQRDLLFFKQEIESHQQQENNDTGQNKTPFLVRISCQITKVLSVLFSNSKIVGIMSKRSSSNFVEVSRWAIGHVCEAITNPNISKSLLSACLQLLKEQKLHSILPTSDQELILYSIINIKKRYVNSSSLMSEKFTVFKSLVINFTPMMEKNAKDWVRYLFTAICCDLDILNASTLKNLAAVSTLLLEASKMFLQSKGVNFEVTTVMNCNLAKFLKVEDELSKADSQTILLLGKTIFSYLTSRLVALAPVKSSLAIDLWLSISLLFFNDPSNLKNHFSEEWLNIIYKCVELKTPETKVFAIKAWRSIVYFTLDSIDKNHGALSNYSLDLINVMFAFFYRFDLTNEDSAVVAAMHNLHCQLLYAIMNNRGFIESFPQLWDNGLSNFFNDHLLRADRDYEKYHSDYDLFSHMMVTKSSKAECWVNPNQRQYQPDFQLMKVLSNDPFNMREIEPFNPIFVFTKVTDFFQLFLDRFWRVSHVPSKTKLTLLSGLLSKLKHAISIKELQASSNYNSMLLQVLANIEWFLEDHYFEGVGFALDTTKVEHFHRFTLLMKTNLGPILFEEYGAKYVKNNIYVTLVHQALKSDVKVINVFKFILNHNKSHEYLFMELLLKDMQTWSSEYANQKASICNFVSNNLESKIFDNMTKNEVESVMRCVDLLAKKTPKMMTNVLKMLLKAVDGQENQFAEMEDYFDKLNFVHWSSEDIFGFVELVTLSFSNSPKTFFNPTVRSDFLKSAILSRLVSKLHQQDSEFVAKFLPGMISHPKCDNWPWLLVSLREHFFYHVIDPKESYPPSVQKSLVSSFRGYIQRLKNISPQAFDQAIAHGLKVCSVVVSAASSTVKVKTRVSQVERDLYFLLKDVDWNSMSSVKQFLDAKNNELSVGNELPEATLNSPRRASSVISAVVNDNISLTETVSITETVATTEPVLITKTVPGSDSMSPVPCSSSQPETSDSYGEKPTQIIEDSRIDEIEDRSPEPKNSLESIDEPSVFEKETTVEPQSSDENDPRLNVRQSRELNYEKDKTFSVGHLDNPILVVDSPPNSTYVDAEELPDHLELPLRAHFDSSSLGCRDTQVIEPKTQEETVPESIIRESGSLELTTEVDFQVVKESTQPDGNEGEAGEVEDDDDEDEDEDDDDIQALERQEYEREIESFKESQYSEEPTPSKSTDADVSPHEISDSNSPLPINAGEFPLDSADSTDVVSKSPFVEEHIDVNDMACKSAFVEEHTDLQATNEAINVSFTKACHNTLENSNSSSLQIQTGVINRKRSLELTTETPVKRNRANEITSSPIGCYSSPTPSEYHTSVTNTAGPFNQIINTLDSFFESSSKVLTDKEAYEIETKLLQLMMKLRKSRF